MFPITFAMVEYSKVIIIASRRNLPCYMPYQSVTLVHIYTNTRAHTHARAHTYTYMHTYISAFAHEYTSLFKTSEFSRVFCEHGFAFDYDRTHNWALTWVHVISACGIYELMKSALWACRSFNDERADRMRCVSGTRIAHKPGETRFPRIMFCHLPWLII